MSEFAFVHSETGLFSKGRSALNSVQITSDGGPHEKAATFCEERS